MAFILGFASDSAFAGAKWAALFADKKIFLEALWYTIRISFGSLILAVVLGVIFGMMATSTVKPLRGIGHVYVQFFQNTPLLIQIFFVYYGLPLVGVVLPVTWIAILAVGVYHGAYVSEVIRSGIQSVPKGQTEAAFSQGFTYLQAMKEIILPQAWRIVLPPFTNQVVSLVKNTSLVAIITGPDIMFTANSWSGTNLYYVPAYIGAAVLYFIICFPLAKLAGYLEYRSKKAY